MESANKTSIQVIDRMMSLLHIIASNEGPVSLKLLSADTGLHPSTTFRILAALIEHGLVLRTERGYYLLGSTLGQSVEQNHIVSVLKQHA